MKANDITLGKPGKHDEFWGLAVKGATKLAKKGLQKPDAAVNEDKPGLIKMTGQFPPAKKAAIEQKIEDSKPWTRGDKIAATALVLTIIAICIAVARG